MGEVGCCHAGRSEWGVWHLYVLQRPVEEPLGEIWVGWWKGGRVMSHSGNSAVAHEKCGWESNFWCYFPALQWNIASLDENKQPVWTGRGSPVRCTFTQMKRSAQHKHSESDHGERCPHASLATKAASGRLNFSHSVYSHAGHMVPFPAILPSSASKYLLSQIHPQQLELHWGGAGPGYGEVVLRRCWSKMQGVKEGEWGYRDLKPGKEGAIPPSRPRQQERGA